MWRRVCVLGTLVLLLAASAAARGVEQGAIQPTAGGDDADAIEGQASTLASPPVRAAPESSAEKAEAAARDDFAKPVIDEAGGKIKPPPPPVDHTKDTYMAAIPKWNYSRGGADWDEGLCKIGKQQSPIAIDTEHNVTLKTSLHGVDGAAYNMNFKYSQGSKLTMVYNGHTLQVDGELGTVETGCPCDPVVYRAFAFHFHTPSGHAFNPSSKSDGRYPVEMRIVHQKRGAVGKTGVMIISVFFEQSPKDEENEFLNQIDWDQAPAQLHVVHYVTNEVDLNLMHDSLSGDFYAYNGSLTTPTCDEGVNWRLMVTTQKASKRQIQAIQSLFVNQEYVANVAHGNVRNLQPLNGRDVVYYHADPHTPVQHLVNAPAVKCGGTAASSCCAHSCCHSCCHAQQEASHPSCAFSSNSDANPLPDLSGYAHLVTPLKK